MNRSKNTRSVATPLLTALLAGVVGASPAWAQTTTVTTTTTTADANTRKVERVDEKFLKDATEGGLSEIEGGKTAATKAVHPDVKAFAQMLIDDHTKANAELAALAASKNVKLPTEPSMVDKAKLKVLAMREADGFDKHFIKSLGVDAHEDTIKRFEKIAREGKDPDVKAFATKSLPTLQHHLQMARDLRARLDKQGKQ